jgi:hypothetical protein
MSLVTPLLLLLVAEPSALPPDEEPLEAARLVDQPPPTPPRDSDRDGLSDALERTINTDPLDPDTDNDGVPDGLEDRNQDGVVDPGESNPRVPGLFPGRAPHIPEPLVFDLVRGLDARRGELEVNTLGRINLRTGRFYWAPELEWAFAKGHAVELELPMLNRELQSIKVALQGAFPTPGRPRMVHGWQAFTDVSLADGRPDGVLLYLFGHRLSRRASILTMLGGAAPLSRLGRRGGAVLHNAAVFFDAAEWSTLGLETNLEIDLRGDWRLAIYPQAHFQASKRLRLQLAPGVGLTTNTVTPLAAFRLILE